MENNCFTFTYQYLKSLGVKVPLGLDDMNYKTEVKGILDNYKYYVKNKLHIKFFDGWTESVVVAQKNDIILHDKGVGIALTKGTFMTLNHLEKISIKPIQKYHMIKRVING